MTRKKNIKKIVLIGAGNVATPLGRAIHSGGYIISQVWSRSEETAASLANELDASSCNSLAKLDQNADLYILSVPDHAIDSILSQFDLKNDQMLVHTSGSLAMSVLKNKTANYGVFYPLQTFSKEKQLGFANIPLLLEADSEVNLHLLFEMANKLSTSVTAIDSEKRKILHLAAVFACNFPNFLYSVAEEILIDKGLPFDLLRPLIIETASKIIETSPGDVQTGPAIRNDQKTIAEHLRMLEGYPGYMSVYELLSDLIINFRAKSQEPRIKTKEQRLKNEAKS